MSCRRLLESGHCRRNARRPRAPLEVGASPTDKAGEQQRGHAYFAVGDCEAFLAQPWVVAGLMQRTQLADLSTTPEKPKNMPIAIAAPLRSTAAARRTAGRGIPVGWRESAQAEVHRVFGHFKCIVYVPLADRAEKIRQYGRVKAHTLHLVVCIEDASSGTCPRRLWRGRSGCADWTSSSQPERTRATERKKGEGRMKKGRPVHPA